MGVTHVDLPDLLQQADIVTLHVPLNEHTQGLIGAEQLALMKPTAMLVNTCRGPVVDEKALTAALTARKIAGAALDVLEQEPPATDNLILQRDNVLLTPHTAGVTVDTWARRGEFIFENIQRVHRGETPLAVVG
ncbi:MAG: NAD(P)-dependent oxidoreductase [Caldilineaceae bacterium]